MAYKRKTVEEQKRISARIEREMKAAKKKRALESLMKRGGYESPFVVPEKQYKAIKKAEAVAKKGPVGYPKKVKYIEPTVKPDHITSMQETIGYKKMQELKRKRREEAELAMAWERGFYAPVEEKLAAKAPTAPEHAKFTYGVLTGVGAPLALALGPPEIREKEIEYAAKYPLETGRKAIVGMTAWPMITGKEMVGYARKGEVGSALGVGATTATMVGVSIAAGKVTYKFAPKLKAYKPKALKGAAKPKLKLKKKVVVKKPPVKKVTKIEAVGERVMFREWLKRGKGVPYSKWYAKEITKMKVAKKFKMKTTTMKEITTELQKDQTFSFVPPPKISPPPPKMVFMPAPKKKAVFRFVPITKTKQRKKQKEMVFTGVIPRMVSKSQEKQRERELEISVFGVRSGTKQREISAQIPKFKQPTVTIQPTPLLPTPRRAGRRPPPKRPRPFLPPPPPIPTPFIFPGLKRKRKRRKKKRKYISREFRYTPTLGGALLRKPIIKAPRIVTGLRMRPRIKRKRKGK